MDSSEFLYRSRNHEMQRNGGGSDHKIKNQSKDCDHLKWSKACDHLMGHQKYLEFEAKLVTD